MKIPLLETAELEDLEVLQAWDKCITGFCYTGGTITAVFLAYVVTYKYIALAAMMFCSAILVPLPASALLLAAGALGSFGYVNFLLAFAIALGANVAGDVLEFWVARRYRGIALRLLESQNAHLVERIRRSIGKYAAATVFFTRFIGGIPGNILTGFAEVPFGQFFLFDVLGNAIQIGGVLYLGYFGGDYWQDIIQAISVIGWGVVILLLGLVVLFYCYRHFKNRERHSP